jgi:hypothetical protein
MRLEKYSKMSNPVRVGEHLISLPSCPTEAIEIPSSLGGVWNIPLNELILNYGLEYDQAFWNRDMLPDFFYKYIPDDTLLLFNRASLLFFAVDEIVWPE